MNRSTRPDVEQPERIQKRRLTMIINALTDELAPAICQATFNQVTPHDRFRKLLTEFAEEIKREAIEL